MAIQIECTNQSVTGKYLIRDSGGVRYTGYITGSNYTDSFRLELRSANTNEVLYLNGKCLLIKYFEHTSPNDSIIVKQEYGTLGTIEDNKEIDFTIGIFGFSKLDSIVLPFLLEKDIIVKPQKETTNISSHNVILPSPMDTGMWEGYCGDELGGGGLLKIHVIDTAKLIIGRYEMYKYYIGIPEVGGDYELEDSGAFAGLIRKDSIFLDLPLRFKKEIVHLRGRCVSLQYFDSITGKKINRQAIFGTFEDPEQKDFNIGAFMLQHIDISLLKPRDH